MANWKFGPNNPDIGSDNGRDAYATYDDGFGNKTVVKIR